MTKKATSIGNMLIAQYMGYFDKSIQYAKRNKIKYNWREDMVEIRALTYHASWEALMPVVIKIHDDATDYKRGTSYDYRSRAGHVVNTLATLSKEKIWKEVVEFIHWYNGDNGCKHENKTTLLSSMEVCDDCGKQLI